MCVTGINILLQIIFNEIGPQNSVILVITKCLGITAAHVQKFEHCKHNKNIIYIMYNV